MSWEDQHDSIDREIEEKASKLEVIRARMVEIALDLVGAQAIRYRGPEHGMTPDGYDCSGFVRVVIDRATEEQGVSLPVPRHANEQWREFGEAVDYRRRTAGDLVFFPSRRKRGIYVVGHVGIVVSNGEYIHSPGKDNTTVSVADLPREQVDLADTTEDDIYDYSPLGIKRVTLPVGSGRWHAH